MQSPEQQFPPAGTDSANGEQDLSAMALPALSGHLWWLSLILSEIFLVTLIIAQLPRPRILLHLVLSALLFFLLFVGFSICARKHVATLSSQKLFIRAGHVLGAAFKWLCSRPFFAWVLFFAASTAAICGALESAESSQVYEGPQEVATLTPPRAMVDHPDYFNLLDSAAPTLTRAAVIALIVLFFLQILTQFDLQIKAVQEAGSEAKSTAATAKKINAMLLEEQARLAQGSSELLHALEANQLNLTTQFLIVTMRELANRQDLQLSTRKVFRDLHVDIKALIERLSEKLRFPTDEALGPPPLTLASLYSTYLKLEALNFEEGGGCRFPTRFANYAVAVAEIVTALEAEFPEKYEYFTILNRSPKQFFNLESGGADEMWALFFLEDFCRGKLNQRMNGRYKRWFVSCVGVKESQRPIEAPEHDEAAKEYERYSILVSKEGQRPIFYLPEDRRTKLATHPQSLGGLDGEHISELLTQASPPQLLDGLKALAAEYSKHEQQSKFSSGFIVTRDPDHYADYLHHKVEFTKLWRALKQYQDPAEPTKTVKFPSPSRYHDFFRPGFPTDFFAVRDHDKEDWVLLIGTTFEFFNPNAVTLLYSDPARHLEDLTWEDLKGHLDTLVDPRRRKDLDIQLYAMADGKFVFEQDRP